ncbi:hypothetical protein PC118_g1914 [Phytophthora cactorum]|uniref:Uncharacterized protein n=1 Tax=Phytophthora cactorum TaxID=29920 RepID=A0A8T1GLD1_9STRA|nr:hypothetical protein PC114_g1333 [Phytophthora cactorum]KAG2997439.1 hypothetical protein PC118_g1914 [Phytophthora cactorum]KAG3101848.1 hypothetical protein PC122_g2519 [Phytophthora cactorum]
MYCEANRVRPTVAEGEFLCAKAHYVTSYISSDSLHTCSDRQASNDLSDD